MRGIAVCLCCALLLSACGSSSKKGSATSRDPASPRTQVDACGALALYHSAEDQFLNENGVDPLPRGIPATPTQLRQEYDAWTKAIGLLRLGPQEIAPDVQIVDAAAQRLRPVLDGINWNIATVANDVDGLFDQAFNTALHEQEFSNASSHLSDYYDRHCSSPPTSAGN